MRTLQTILSIGIVVALVGNALPVPIAADQVTGTTSTAVARPQRI